MSLGSSGGPGRHFWSAYIGTYWYQLGFPLFILTWTQNVSNIPIIVGLYYRKFKSTYEISITWLLVGILLIRD